ncbi:hypothetical protein NSR52_003357 [Salmonella enterica]|nr:hypothetical protein [Salmonella enterica]EJW2025226.1 hypothetical protein [Salmonella enterica]EJW2101172.1 hypothetical protein [Salmonella enterica]
MTLYEMEGFLRGKCLPGDMKVNESNAQYLVRKFSELQSQNADMAVQFANAESKCRQLAAENAGLKSTCDDRRTFIMNGVQLGYIKVPTVETDPALETIRVAVSPQEPTPATDVFLAEVRASARNEGINYAASRLAAAFNHGFLDKPVSEVLDVTRMILSAKEDLSNDPLPADDGLSGEYAEKAIEEWADQIRKGVQS